MMDTSSFFCSLIPCFWNLLTGSPYGFRGGFVWMAQWGAMGSMGSIPFFDVPSPSNVEKWSEWWCPNEQIQLLDLGFLFFFSGWCWHFKGIIWTIDSCKKAIWSCQKITKCHGDVGWIQRKMGQWAWTGKLTMQSGAPKWRLAETTLEHTVYV